jgi:hypothetical protein
MSVVLAVPDFIKGNMPDAGGAKVQHPLSLVPKSRCCARIEQVTAGQVEFGMGLVPVGYARLRRAHKLQENNCDRS